MAKKKHIEELCPICSGELVDELITHTEQDAQGNFCIYEHVPAQVCTKCGEYLLADKTTARMDRLTEQAKPHRTIQAPVYDLARP